jgi:hypothetical protein
MSAVVMQLKVLLLITTQRIVTAFRLDNRPVGVFLFISNSKQEIPTLF